MGGAMELATKAKKVIVLMNHTDKDGKIEAIKNMYFAINGATMCAI